MNCKTASCIDCNLDIAEKHVLSYSSIKMKVLMVIKGHSDFCSNLAQSRIVQFQEIHSIEETLSYENYKPLTMSPSRFMGRCILLSFAYSKCKTFLCSFVTDAINCTW